MEQPQIRNVADTPAGQAGAVPTCTRQPADAWLSGPPRPFSSHEPRMNSRIPNTAMVLPTGGHFSAAPPAIVLDLVMSGQHDEKTGAARVARNSGGVHQQLGCHTGGNHLRLLSGNAG